MLTSNVDAYSKVRDLLDVQLLDLCTTAHHVLNVVAGSDTDGALDRHTKIRAAYDQVLNASDVLYEAGVVNQHLDGVRLQFSGPVSTVYEDLRLVRDVLARAWTSAWNDRNVAFRNQLIYLYNQALTRLNVYATLEPSQWDTAFVVLSTYTPVLPTAQELVDVVLTAHTSPTHTS